MDASDTTQIRNTPEPGSTIEPLTGWRRQWIRIMEVQIGIVPLPVFIALLLVIAVFTLKGKVASDLTMAIGILAVGGFTFAELGKRVPLISILGAAAILAFVVPSAMSYYGWIPAPVVASVKEFTKVSNFLYLYIAAIIVGSVLSMNRAVLVAGFLKILVPLSAGSIAALVVGTLVGMLVGHDAYHALFFIVIPMMAGGLGEGAIPLSIGYSLLMHQPQDVIFAQVIPVVMLGSFTAVLLAGLLNTVGKKFPHLTGEGRLQPGVGDEMPGLTGSTSAPNEFNAADLGSAVITIVTLYLLGTVGQKLFEFPAPITMLVLIVLMKLLRMIPARLERAGKDIYIFFSRIVTFPLLFAMGIALTPWKEFVSAFTIPTVITVFATVFTMMGTGFFVARFVGMYPIDVAIVNGCHSGQGGTGDIAILTAGNRMALMPFSQISTRIGGAITVTLALIAFRYFV